MLDSHDDCTSALLWSQVNGFENAHCYELVDIVMRTKILKSHQVFDKYEFTEDFEDMGSPTVESLPPGAGHTGGTLEVYREHLVCTPLKGSQKEVCLRPEGLSQFLRLIGSVPLDRQGLLSAHWKKGPQARSTEPQVLPPYYVHHHRYILSYPCISATHHHFTLRN
jgi:hypothetical protein